MPRKKVVKEPEPTAGEKANGWTREALLRYLSERDEAMNGIHGLGLHAGHEVRRIRVINAGDYDPWESR